METAVLAKRVWLYIINVITYNGVGFGAALPFLLILKFHPALYVLIGLGLSTVFAFLFAYLILLATRGYTFASALLHVKYVTEDGEKLRHGQIIIRAALESLTVFAILDFIYFIKNRTERGVIDRVSDSFAIDTRL